MAQASGFNGIFIGKTYIQKKILRLTDEEISDIEKDIKKNPPITLVDPTQENQ